MVNPWIWVRASGNGRRFVLVHTHETDWAQSGALCDNAAFIPLRRRVLEQLLL